MDLKEVGSTKAVFKREQKMVGSGPCEDMGAVFHNTMDIQSELYSGRGLQDAHAQIPKLALFSIVEELGMEMSFLSLLKCLNVT